MRELIKVLAVWGLLGAVAFVASGCDYQIGTPEIQPELPKLLSPMIKPEKPVHPEPMTKPPPIPKQAPVKLASIELANPALCPTDEYDHFFSHAAANTGLDARALKAQAAEESNCRPRVCSSKDACGMMQLKEAAAKQVKVTDRFNPRQNIAGGARYQSWCERMWNRHNRTEAEVRANGLACYNAGPKIPIDCQIENGGLHVREWKNCLPTETWDYVIDVPRTAGLPDGMKGVR